jgi:hypothetical protein
MAFRHWEQGVQPPALSLLRNGAGVAHLNGRPLVNGNVQAETALARALR